MTTRVRIVVKRWAEPVLPWDRSLYGTKLAIDGVYGSNTRAVVRMVQRRHKLAADGIYGPKTRSAMNWRLYSMSTRSWSRGCSSPL